MEKKLDLKTFAFPSVSFAEMIFPTFKTIPDLLEEAKLRGYYNMNNHSDPYLKAFAKLFYEGGSVKFKDGLDEHFKKSCWSYCRAFMASWEPKHEEKTAICAMLMSECIEPEIEISQAKL